MNLPLPHLCAALVLAISVVQSPVSAQPASASKGVSAPVAITPASGFVSPGSAVIIGGIAGVACYWGATGLKRILGVDDSLDVFGVHGIGGIVGAVLSGVFASPTIGGVEGNVQTQLVTVAVTLVYSALMTALIVIVIGRVVGLRVSKQDERDGLDLSQHGERVE